MNLKNKKNTFEQAALYLIKNRKDICLKFSENQITQAILENLQTEKFKIRNVIIGLEIGHYDYLEEGQIYSTGGGAGESYRWFIPKTLEETDEFLDEDLRKWFKEKWVRFGPDGKIRGPCARGSSSEGKPKCLPQKKAHSLGKKKRASAAARKRREDPNPERSGKAINVATKKNEGKSGSHLRGLPFKVQNLLDQILELRMQANIAKDRQRWNDLSKFNDQIDKIEEYILVNYPDKGQKFIDDFYKTLISEPIDEKINEVKCPHCNGELVSEELINEKKDACYYKVKSRYKVWPSAYASGALVKCRKKGASNWGKSKVKESAILKGILRK